MGQRPTIKDIARLAGVTPATVSLALHRNPRISAGTREKIAALAERLNYSPNYAARSLVGSHSRTLGLVITSIRNPFYSELTEGIEAKAVELGYTVVLASTTHDRRLQRRHIDVLRARGVDGIVFTSVEMHDPDLRPLIEDRYPFVLVNRRTHSRRLDERIDWVVLDNVAGGRQAVEHLLRLGHRRIAVIAGTMTVSTAWERTEGARRALRDAGVALDPELHVECDFSFESAYEETRKLLARRRRPTAIFAENDYMALSVREAILDAKLRIPEDVALVGFDDISAGALRGVDLTTVGQRKYEMGTMAVEILCRRIEHPSAPPRQVTLEPEMVVRRSCGVHLQRKPRRARAAGLHVASFTRGRRHGT